MPLESRVHRHATPALTWPSPSQHFPATRTGLALTVRGNVRANYYLEFVTGQTEQTARVCSVRAA